VTIRKGEPWAVRVGESAKATLD